MLGFYSRTLRGGLKFSSTLSAIVFATFWLATTPLLAAPPSTSKVTAAKLPKPVRKALKQVEDYMAQMRVPVSGLMNRVRQQKSQSTSINSMQKSLEDKLKKDEELRDLFLGQLNEKNFELYGLQNREFVLPELFQLNGDVGDLGELYFKPEIIFGQPGAPGVDYVDAYWFDKRKAMGIAIDSQASDFTTVRDRVLDAASYLTTIGNRLLSISNGSSLNYVRYGHDHYFERLADSLSTRVDAYMNLPVMFDGHNANGDPLPEYLVTPCPLFEETEYPTMAAELELVLSFALGAQDFNEFRDLVDDLKVLYEGDTSEGIIGYISHWSGCIGSRQNNIDILRQAQNIALSEGNIGGAGDYERRIADFENETVPLVMERELLKLRLAQFGRIVDSAAKLNNNNNPVDAWREMVNAHVQNLLAIMPTLRLPFHASSELLQRAADEIPVLIGVGDLVELNDLMKTTDARLDSIVSNGFNTFSAELLFVRNSLNILADQIRIGEEAIFSGVETFIFAIQLQENIRSEDLSEIPGQIADVQDEIFEIEESYVEALEFVQATQTALNDFLAAKAKYQEILGRLEVLNVDTQNPLMNAMADLLLEEVRGYSAYNKVRIPFETAVLDFLRAFDAILDPGGVGSPPARFAFLRGGGGSLARQLKNAKRDLLYDKEFLIEETSARFLNGTYLPELVQELEAKTNQLFSLGVPGGS